MTIRCPGDDGIARLTQVIVVLDVVESVRLMEADEPGFIDRWRGFVHLARHGIVPLHGGRTRKSLGDGLLLEFDQAMPALHAASALVQCVQRFDVPGCTDLDIRLRVGLHLACYVADDLDIYGAGVNLAARLAQAAEGGEILLSATVRDRLPPEEQGLLEDVGARVLRHVSRPTHVYRLRPAAAVLPGRLHPLVPAEAPAEAVTSEPAAFEAA